MESIIIPYKVDTQYIFLNKYILVCMKLYYLLFLGDSFTRVKIKKVFGKKQREVLADVSHDTLGKTHARSIILL